MATSPHAWLCRHIVDHTRDAIIFADREGIIRRWNAGAETIFGCPAAEAIRHSLDRRLLAVPALRKDGTQISVEFTAMLVQEPPGEVRGNAAVLRDVTARWQREKALRARLAVRESTPQA
jgi:PAS domain-containing protein